VQRTVGAGVGVEIPQTTSDALTTTLVLTGNALANTIIGNAAPTR
jgi:hypothetical protein